jgi:Fur family ferric uptake transcriptional regulator
MSKVEEILKKHSLSVTAARKNVLELFLKSNAPICVNDIKRKKFFKTINESSIYRNLSKLEEAGIIQVIPGAGEFQYYEMIPTGHHHHHITCKKCKAIKCLNICGLEKKMKEMADSVGYHLVGHSVELIGLCKKCYAG